MKELKELLKLYKISRINHSVVHNILIEYDKKEFDKYEKLIIVAKYIFRNLLNGEDKNG